MNKLVVLLMLLTAMLFTAGCTDKTQEKSTSFEASLEKKDVVKVTQLEQINTSLKKGPVFVKLGAKWCPSCRSMKPILEKLAAEYGANATIASVDVDQSPELTEYFGVEIIPDSFVIVGIENETYVYMKEDGKVTTEISQAKFVGFDDNDEKLFEKTLDLALLQEGKNKSS